MTAIAYRAGIMAADSVGWTCHQASVSVPVAPKIRRLPDGGIFACAGAITEIDRFRTWMLEGGERPADIAENDLDVLWAKPDGTLWLCSHKLHFYQVHSEFFVIGSPTAFMMGAMHAGASAAEAVRLATLHTDSAGGTVQVERLNAGDVIEIPADVDPRAIYRPEAGLRGFVRGFVRYGA